jgi:hypothetical protein
LLLAWVSALPGGRGMPFAYESLKFVSFSPFGDSPVDHLQAKEMEGSFFGEKKGGDMTHSVHGGFP